MIIINNKTVRKMYFQKRSTSADESLPVEVKRAYYNNQLVFGEITPPDIDTRPRIEITANESLLTGSPYYIMINGIKKQANEVKQDSQGRNVYIYLITEQITSLKYFMNCEAGLGYTIYTSPNFYLVEFKYCDSMIASSLGDCISAFANPWIYEIKGMGNWNVTMKDAGNMFLRCNRLRGVLDIHNWIVNASTGGWFAITNSPNINEVLTIYADNLSSTSWVNWGYDYGKEIIMYCTQATKTAMKKQYDKSSKPSDYLIWKVVPDEDDRVDESTKTYVRTIQPDSSFNISASKQSITIEIIDVFKYKKHNSSDWIEREEKTSYILDNLGTNESETETRTINRTISHRGQEYNITIIQDVKLQSTITWDLNNGDWEEFTPTDGDNNKAYYFRSDKHKGQANSFDKMTIRFSGDIPGGFWIGIRSYAETTFDYTIASKIDTDITSNINSASSMVKSHTKGIQLSGNALSKYTVVDYSTDYNDPGEHFITVIYRKDSTGEALDDRGYVIIPKKYEERQASVVNDEPLQTASVVNDEPLQTASDINTLKLCSNYSNNSYNLNNYF